MYMQWPYMQVQKITSNCWHFHLCREGPLPTRRSVINWHKQQGHSYLLAIQSAMFALLLKLQPFFLGDAKWSTMEFWSGAGGTIERCLLKQRGCFLFGNKLLQYSISQQSSETLNNAVFLPKKMCISFMTPVLKGLAQYWGLTSSTY